MFHGRRSQYLRAIPQGQGQYLPVSCPSDAAPDVSERLHGQLLALASVMPAHESKKHTNQPSTPINDLYRAIKAAYTYIRVWGKDMAREPKYRVHCSPLLFLEPRLAY